MSASIVRKIGVFFWQIVWKQCLQVCVLYLFLSILAACIGRSDTTPIGRKINWESGEVSELRRIYEEQESARYDEVGFKIELAKNKYSPTDEIIVHATLTNRTDHDITVLKMYMQTDREYEIFYGVKAVIEANDPNVSVEFEETLSGFDLVQYSRPPEAFVKIQARQRYSECLELLPIKEPLPAGRYNLYLMYANQDFGADVVNESGSYFLDFDAWMGELQSNTVTFEIIEN